MFSPGTQATNLLEEIPQATTTDLYANKMAIAHIFINVNDAGGNPHHMLAPIYLCIFSGCCLPHHSHPLTTATAASCQRRSAAAEGEGRSAKSPWFWPKGTCRRGGFGGGGLVNRTSGSHLDQKEAHWSGMGCRLSMQGRKWEVMRVCMLVCMFFNVSLIAAATLISTALCAFVDRLLMRLFVFATVSIKDSCWGHE